MSKKILLATDGSEQSRGIEEYVRDFFGPDTVELTILSVGENLEGKAPHEAKGIFSEPDSLRDDLTDIAEKAVSTMGEHLRDRGYTVKTITRVGNPGEEICEYAQMTDIESIIMGRRGRGEVSELLLGSVSQYVVHHSELPVTLVTPETIKDECS